MAASVGDERRRRCVVTIEARRVESGVVCGVEWEGWTMCVCDGDCDR